MSERREVPMSSDRELLWEIHRLIEEHLGIGQREPRVGLGEGQENANVLRPVSDPGEPGSGSAMRTIERYLAKQSLGEGEINRPQDASTAEE
jgi:hypothetical protein